jgi:hypothetical protein
MGRADVLGGRGANSTWFGPSQTPMSGHVQFAVNLTGTSASSAQFTITRSDNTQLTVSASASQMQGGAVYAITPAIGTFGWPNGEWEVTAQASTHTGPIFWGPTTFDIKNLNVTALTATGSASVLDSRFFVSVRPGAAQGLELEGTWTDGYEISLPMGNNPNLVDVTYGLRPLSLGSQASASATGVAPGAIVASMTNVMPGLYYKTGSGVERRPLYEPGNDTAATHATTLSISSLTKTGFSFTQARTGCLLVNARTTDSPANSAVTDGEWAWRTPSGDLEVTSGGDHPDDSMAIYSLTSPTLEFDEAGTYILAATFRDDHARPHDGAKEYCVPKSTTVEVPAATCNGQDSDFGMKAALAYDYLGRVFGAVPAAQTFYSARYPRPGISVGIAKTSFLDALADDEVIYNAAHGNVGYALTGSGISVTTDDVLSLPFGAAAQARLVYLDSCYSATQPALLTLSLAAAISQHAGAQTVVGYDGPAWAPCPMGDFFCERLWAHWALNGLHITEGISLAKIELQVNWGSLGYASNIRTLVRASCQRHRARLLGR